MGNEFHESVIGFFIDDLKSEEHGVDIRVLDDFQDIDKNRKIFSRIFKEKIMKNKYRDDKYVTLYVEGEYEKKYNLRKTDTNECYLDDKGIHNAPEFMKKKGVWKGFKVYKTNCYKNLKTGFLIEKKLSDVKFKIDEPKEVRVMKLKDFVDNTFITANGMQDLYKAIFDKKIIDEASKKEILSFMKAKKSFENMGKRNIYCYKTVITGTFPSTCSNTHYYEFWSFDKNIAKKQSLELAKKSKNEHRKSWVNGKSLLFDRN